MAIFEINGQLTFGRSGADAKRQRRLVNCSVSYAKRWDNDERRRGDESVERQGPVHALVHRN